MRARPTAHPKSRLLLILLVFSASAFAPTPGAFAADVPLTCARVPEQMTKYLSKHISSKTLDEALARRAADLFIDTLDSSKSHLLVAEEEALRKELVAFIAGGIKLGQCDVLDKVHQRRLGWHREMEAYVRQALADPKLEIDRSIELVIDVDKRQRPGTKADRDALRRKLVHFQLANYVSSGTALPEAKKKLTKRYELLTKRFTELSTADVMAQFLDSFASALDPHTTYFSADALEDFRIGMALSLEGIGAVLRSGDGYTLVQEVVPGGAAARQGELKTKDRIIAVTQLGTAGEPEGDPVDVVDMSLRDVVKLIRGKKGTKVQLTVLRQAARHETLKIVIERDQIDLKEQAARLRWEKVTVPGRTEPYNLAVLELPSFYGGSRPGSRQCADDVQDLLEEVRTKKADGLVLDLSRNSGGLLDAAVRISGFFFHTGPVVAIDGTDAAQVLEDLDPTVQYEGPLVVLTSRASASASEIVAGAIKDYARGLIVGDDRTFGKGTVQNVIYLPPGLGALKVTTAMFFRPGGKSTQHSGIEADIVVPSPFNFDEFGESQQRHALPPQEKAPFRSPTVNSGPRRWAPVDRGLVSALAKRSGQRVEGDAAFKELREKLAKTQKNRGAVKIGELLDDSKPGAGGEDEEDDEKPKSDELTPQAKEALNILADLIHTTQGKLAGR